MAPELIVVIGAYGSGKSEYAINLAEQYKNRYENKISLVDLDIVNPYFRSRDVRNYFNERGINVISPEGEYAYADLPMISPKISGAIQQKDQNVILDVGGDPAGCRALARFTDLIIARGYQMQFVVNTLRPFTTNAKDIKEMKHNLEKASKLKISEIISNTNLLDETEEDQIIVGIDILNKVAEEENIKFDKYLVLDKLQENISESIKNKKRMILKYYLSKPWEIPIMTKGI